MSCTCHQKDACQNVLPGCSGFRLGFKVYFKVLGFRLLEFVWGLLSRNIQKPVALPRAPGLAMAGTEAKSCSEHHQANAGQSEEL